MLEGMGREGMRAADTDRERVAEQLRAALNAGRLDLSEYDERLRHAYAAKTYGELDPLLEDLPASAPAIVPLAPQQGAGHTREWLVGVWSSWGGMAAFFTVIWAIGGLGYYWPAWVIGPWGLVLVWTTVKGLATGEPRRHAAEREHVRQMAEFKKERRALQAEAVARGALPASPSKDERRAFEAEAIAAKRLRPRPERPVSGF